MPARFHPDFSATIVSARVVKCTGQRFSAEKCLVERLYGNVSAIQTPLEQTPEVVDTLSVDATVHVLVDVGPVALCGE